MSLRSRIALATGAAVALTVALVSAASYTSARGQLRAQIDTALRQTATMVAANVTRTDGRRAYFDPGVVQAGRFGGAIGARQHIAPGGRTTRPPNNPLILPVDDQDRALARRGEGIRLRDATVSGVHERIITFGLGRGAGAIQVARPLTETDAVLRRQFVSLLVIGGLGILLAAALGFLVAGSAPRPIARFTRRTESITSGADPTERIEVTGSDELGRLALSFNNTLDALEASVEAQRHMVADASHELRTPLASLRANVQLLERADELDEADRAALRADIVSELDELTALVADILELARGTKRGAQDDDVRVHEIVAHVAERARRHAGARVPIRTDIQPSVVVGDPERIARAVANLIDNAVKYGGERGGIDVRLRDGVLGVRDHGPGFAATDLPHVFERFYRADAARTMPGSGLGLAIVAQAAEAHGGWTRASNAEGGGALLEVSFGEGVTGP